MLDLPSSAVLHGALAIAAVPIVADPCHSTCLDSLVELIVEESVLVSDPESILASVVGSASALQLVQASE